MALVDLRAEAPPPDWGVTVDSEAIARIAEQWASDDMPLPEFAYPGTPNKRDEAWWFDYVTLSVSVLACLWPPEGDDMWQTRLHGQWLDDAPGIFAAFTDTLDRDGVPLDWYAELTPRQGADLFRGRGTLQLIPERSEQLRRVALTIRERWDGSVRNLVDEADRNATRVAELLTETMPGYQDRPHTSAGTLPFDKLSHLAAAIMAAGVGWSFSGYEDFPVYPDYMLPRVFRHHRALVYTPELAEKVDTRTVLAADSVAEHAIRWGTVYAGGQLLAALNQHGNPVTAPGLDYRLWSEAVLGPGADSFGEHHRTITMRY